MKTGKKITTKEAAAPAHHEIAHLAYLNWERDGCPHGRDRQYWLEAEHQIKATKHLLLAECQPQANRDVAARKPGLRQAPKSAVLPG